MGRVEGKSVIVTGSASGIGRATALLLATEGARVVVADVNREQGAEAAAESGNGALFMELDVSDENNWKTVIGDTVSGFGGLDVLVNNAGISGDDGPVADPENTTVDNWLAIHKVNALGPFLGCKHAIPAMRENGSGSIVNISSAGALIPSPMNTPYGSAKAGLTNLTITVAIHCAVKGDNIRCNAVYPGGTRTPMLQGLFEVLAQKAGTSADEVADSWGGGLPLGRLADPKEIANAILFLASDESSYVNAEQLVVDGGRRYPTLLAEE